MMDENNVELFTFFPSLNLTHCAMTRTFRPALTSTTLLGRIAIMITKMMAMMITKMMMVMLLLMMLIKPVKAWR